MLPTLCNHENNRCYLLGHKTFPVSTYCPDCKLFREAVYGECVCGKRGQWATEEEASENILKPFWERRAKQALSGAK